MNGIAGAPDAPAGTQGLLDLPFEFLPLNKQMAEMKAGTKGPDSSGPVGALAYTQDGSYKEIARVDVCPMEDYFHRRAESYFPRPLAEGLSGTIARPSPSSEKSYTSPHSMITTAPA